MERNHGNEAARTRGPVAQAIARVVQRIGRVGVSIHRAVAYRLIACRAINPWFHSSAGVAFVRALFERRRAMRSFSRATRRANQRFYVLQPLTIIPVQRAWFKARHGFWPISMLAISPTTRCNLACRGCFSAGAAGQAELSTELFDRIMGEALAMGVRMFVLIGGEPFCWEPLIPMLERYPQGNFGIYTNGTLIDTAMARKLGELGNATIQFSVEGFETETDARRGTGVFSKVIDAMAACRAAGVHFGYSVTVTRGNNDLVVSDRFVEFFADQGCFEGWYYQYMPVGDHPDPALIPTADQRARRVQRFRALRRRNLVNIFDFLNDGPLVGGCIAGGRRYVHINAEGDIEPCAFYPFAVDNIRNSSLRAALQSPFMQRIRAYQARTCNLRAPCPVVDHAEWLRDVVRVSRAHATRVTAPALLDGLGGQLDEHGRRYRAVADEMWRKEGARA